MLRTSSRNMAGTSTSTMTMTISPSSLVVDFALVEKKTGDKTTSRITFSR